MSTFPSAADGATAEFPAVLRRKVGSLEFEATIMAPDTFLAEMTDAFSDLEMGCDPNVEPVVVRVTTDHRMDGRPLFQIHIEGLPRWRTDDAAAAVDHMVTSLTRIALERTTGRVHLHGGLVAGPDGAVLLTGRSGAGKSTLVAAATRGGAYSYVTDEMVGIDLYGPHVHGLVKPLTFKRSTWALHEDLLGPPPERGERWAARASRLGEVSVSGPHLVALIVFPAFVDGATCAAQRVHPATTVVRLITETLDMERGSREAFHRLVELARRADAVELTYGDASVAVREIERICRSSPRPTPADPSGHSGEPVPTGNGVNSRSDLGRTRQHPQRSPSTEWTMLENRAVLYDPGSGVSLELDEVASLWWMALDGEQSVDQVAAIFAEATGEDAKGIERAGRHLLKELDRIGVLQP